MRASELATSPAPPRSSSVLVAFAARAAPRLPHTTCWFSELPLEARECGEAFGVGRRRGNAQFHADCAIRST